jgi:hypothetical protein
MRISKSKFETRNFKQIQMTKETKSKTSRSYV